MNKGAFNILRYLIHLDNLGQDCIALQDKFNLSIERITALIDLELIAISNDKLSITKKGKSVLEKYRVDNAIILAAGIGSRFVPLSYEVPKGLLEVHGERLIERQIKQLIEASIKEIIIVVGYRKEQFEYLTEKYGLKLIFNPEYAIKNNLSSLYYARDYLRNSYILSSDNYLINNLFNSYEFNSWYCMVKTEGRTNEWSAIMDESDRILKINIGSFNQWHIYGPAYFSDAFSKSFIPIVERYYNEGTDDYYWEDALRRNLDKLAIYANRQEKNTIYEFESLEELREFDLTYKENTGSFYMATIASYFNIKESDISSIIPIKKGMTNNTFLFEVNYKKYICRIPLQDAEELIDRNAELINYQSIALLNIAESIILLNPSTGVKITVYEDNVKYPDINNIKDLHKCVKILKRVHNSNIVVPHKFIFKERITFFEKFCKNRNADLAEDYQVVKKKMIKLMSKIDKIDVPFAFCHIDFNCDNLLILPDGTAKLIDWEYASMSDPLVDLAMFAIYSNLNKSQTEKIMSLYFDRDPDYNESLRIYSYVALGGFLWYLWAVYMESLGRKFGSYKMNMYKYAKDYYEEVSKILNEKNVTLL